MTRRAAKGRSVRRVAALIVVREGSVEPGAPKSARLREWARFW